MQKIGIGYDVHELIPNRDLILGGVNIKYEVDGKQYGLLAHSDGDVLAHAVIDALLGAAGLGDIGYQFPDTDDQYKDINSMELLKRTSSLIDSDGYSIINIDATLIAQEPKINHYRNEMAKNMAAALNISPQKINIKATTEEGLGFTGRKEGMAAQAICLLQHSEQKM
ncbi:MAG: 2-C-methyl-D-erythritol 2,4-cyclodiphosphate synthase [Defluviitaleaceae bacterium]|nr:2-C-methyl-D-erythritol 2,4-cyclodiphosphate synthase [Defluviitaleaceae bacterium]